MILLVDIGGTNVKYALSDLDGQFVERGMFKTPQTKNELLHCLCALDFDYEGIAISLPGIVHEDGHSVFVTGELSYLSGFNICSYLQKIKGCPVILENDGRCATLAEQGFGNLKESTNGLVIVVGTSIGMGLVFHHQLYTGSNGFAGEYSDSLTLKGKKLVHVLGRKALEERVGMSGKDLFDDLDDECVYSLFNDYCLDFAKMICDIQLLLDLDTILIGGGISAQTRFIEMIVTNVHKLSALFPTMHVPKIQSCKYGNDANLLGALYKYKKRVH